LIASVVILHPYLLSFV
jgi:hypothetical protein